MPLPARNLVVVAVLLVAGPVFAQEKTWKELRADGRRLLAAFRVESAAGSFEAALRLAREFDSKDSRLAESLVDLGETRDMQRRFVAAEGLYREAVVVLERIHGREHALLLDSLEKHSRACRKLSKHAEAAALGERAIAIGEKGAKTLTYKTVIS